MVRTVMTPSNRATMHLTPESREHSKQPTSESGKVNRNRRSVLKAATAALFGLGAAGFSVNRYFEAGENDIYPLAKNFPNDLNGIHHIDEQLLLYPNSKQCIIRFVSLHANGANATEMVEYDPALIKLWKNCGSDTDNAIDDLSNRYPDYNPSTVYCEGVRATHNKGAMAFIDHIKQKFGEDVSPEKLWYLACEQNDNDAHAFLKRFGPAARHILNGSLEVRGTERDDISAEIAPWMRLASRKKKRPEEYPELMALFDKRAYHTLDAITQGKEQFPILLNGNGHDLVPTALRRNRDHPKDPPLSMITLWPNATIDFQNESSRRHDLQIASS